MTDILTVEKAQNVTILKQKSCFAFKSLKDIHLDQNSAKIS